MNTLELERRVDDNKGNSRYNRHLHADELSALYCCCDDSVHCLDECVGVDG